MAFVSTFDHTNSMTDNIMNSEKLQQLKDNYANMIVDRLDMDTLCQLAFDLLVANYDDISEEQLKADIVDLYDEKTCLLYTSDAADE